MMAALVARRAIRTSQLARARRPATASFIRDQQPVRRIWRTSPTYRAYSSEAIEPVEAPEYLSDREKKIFDMIKDGLKPTKLEVQDISGGCGSMYALDIVSDQFAGLPVIKQHRLVNQVLGDEMKKWHGVQMKTKAPS